MALDRNRLLAVADRVRPIAAPFRTTAVTIRKRTWTGTQVGEGTSSDVDLVLPPYVKVVELSNKEIASSGGKLLDGAVRVGPITPTYLTSDGQSGGFTIADLTPSADDNSQEVIYLLSGACAGEYRLFSSMNSRPFRYELTLNRTRNAQT